MPGKVRGKRNWGWCSTADQCRKLSSDMSFGTNDFSTWVNHSDNLLDLHLVLRFLNMSHMGSSTLKGIVSASVKGGYGSMEPFHTSFWGRCLFRATPMAYASSQTRGQIRAVAATATARQDPSLVFDTHYSSWQHIGILNPPSKARDGTHILMDTSLVHYFWATMGTPPYFLLKPVTQMFQNVRNRGQ